jgi:hypothetical protein
MIDCQALTTMIYRFDQNPSILQAFAWSESIVADVLYRHYLSGMDGGLSDDRMFALHLHFWKALIFGSETVSWQHRRALVAAAFESGVDLASLSEIDEEVVAELLEVVLRRFRTTPLEARDHHLLLLSVAARLRIAALADHLGPEHAPARASTGSPNQAMSGR